MHVFCTFFVLVAFILVAVLFTGVVSAQEQQPRTFRIPFHTVNNVFFWLLLGLAIAGTVWFLAGIVRVFLSEKFRVDVDRQRKLRDQRRSQRGKHSKRGKHLLLLGLLTVMLLLFSGVLFTGIVSAQESPRTFRVPFREVNHRILVEVEVDGGTPATFLFDTGARVSVLFNPTGHDCGLRLAHHAHGKFALACDGSSPTVAFTAPESGVRFNGFIGADLMSKFSAVRIDFKAHVVELEE